MIRPALESGSILNVGFRADTGTLFHCCRERLLEAATLTSRERHPEPACSSGLTRKIQKPGSRWMFLVLVAFGVCGGGLPSYLPSAGPAASSPRSRRLEDDDTRQSVGTVEI
jgi:hypothetical protein